MEEPNYTSGKGKNSVVPPQIKGWNWGACLLNWIWGLGNNTFIALLMFVPIVNVVMFFMLGAKGNEWAWKNNIWRDVEHFKKVQKKWRNASFALLIIVALPLITTLSYNYISNMYKMDAFKQSYNVLGKNPNVIKITGPRLEVALTHILDDYQHTDTPGERAFFYYASGFKGSVQVQVIVRNEFFGWSLQRVIVKDSDSPTVINVLDKSE
ncbi:MAG: cytochrome c oxidase assembly factor Coa1 family protein [Pseudoalteromonas sp.]|uniref:cytochrome c oxidase assembly factor Coa1 family protein n=1 Tax=unclassified Pseudoalteromonas TaxID=194690 RepID=UPI003F9C473F